MAIENYYPFAESEPRWQKAWSERGIAKACGDGKKPPYYILEMFPYPSGKLHMGHVRVYTIGDALARFKRMQGFDVMHPMGFDAFGLPAENAAHKHSTHPSVWTERCIDMMRDQLLQLGISYDWDREVATCRPDYYRWNQWLFLRMYERGLIYRKQSAVNWCPKCNTVLANEQVLGNGCCWRHEDTPVEVRQLKQWFIKITDYAEELLSDLDDKLGAWPNLVTAQQKNWIGRSEGAEIKFTIKETGDELPIFTTRPDTLFGVTFMSIAPEHPLIDRWITGKPNEKDVRDFIAKVVHEGAETRTDEGAEKHGMALGLHAINPVNGREVPIYIANFVLMQYGTGAVMAVPAHDQRDFEFAKKYNIPIDAVIQPEGETLDPATMPAAWTEPGVMVNSEQFDGMASAEAKRAITEWCAEKGFGKGTVQYRLRDWLISRQRFWGTPIPFYYVEGEDEPRPMPLDQLPIKLPADAKFEGQQGNPLLSCGDWLNFTCPVTGKPARRETDTMDTFFDSSWYFIRYCDPHNTELPIGPEAAKSWLAVDHYVGGKEHAILHLLYARFFTKVFRDLGLIPAGKDGKPVNEPFKRLLTQGMVCKDGVDPRTGEKRVFKMSKSIGNVVDPGAIIAEHGADVARCFILFAAPPEKDLEWSDQAVEGISRFLNRFWRWTQKNLGAIKAGREAGAGVKAAEVSEKADKDLLRVINVTIQRVTVDMAERFQFNTALASCMELLNAMYEYKGEGALPQRLTAMAAKTLTTLLSPFAPHLTEEIWELTGFGAGGSLAAEEAWPHFEEAALAVDEIEIVLQILGKNKSKLMIAPGAAKADVLAAAKTEERIAELLEGKQIIKEIYVPGKLVNFVAK